MKINPKSFWFLILNLSKSPKISRFSTKNGKFEDSIDFRDNFLTISVTSFQSQTAFIPRKWSKFWKTTKCEIRIYHGIYLIWVKPVGTEFGPEFDPIWTLNTLKSTKSYLDLSALEIMSFRKIGKSWFLPVGPKNHPFS